MAGLTAPGRNGEFFHFSVWGGVVSLVLRVSPFIARADEHKNFARC